ncbi:MAG: hypothetical protein JXA20_20100 [Spirochaetes bacterium]|nr:hypothetical protein [Spirochaetota bacterium]
MDRQTYRLVSLITVFILVCGYLFLFSEGGVLERSRLKRSTRELSRKTSEIKGESGRLRSLLQQYEAGRVREEDLVNSGYLRENDTIVILRELDPAQRRIGGPEVFESDGTGYLIPYRIGWGIVSISVVVLLILLRPKRVTEEQGY